MPDILPNSADGVGGPTWYTDAASYWDKVEPSIEGMLGGFGKLTDIDCSASLKFIDEFVNGKKGPGGKLVSQPRIEKLLACDCGAGIGRVTKHFLLQAFHQVDMVEQNPKFLEEARKTYLAHDASRVQQYIPKGLQEFVPEERRYDMIWIQWVLGHLTDDDFVAFFQRCKRGLKPNGLIGVKENVTITGVDVDKEDSSVTRRALESDEILKQLFAKAGLKLVKEDTQKNFPKGLYGVRMYILE
ncbi:hypothetical protein HDU85_001400 [Gaertneriomyces sp. JEL0708]|nr:hypothetical protein HDU85_001400 [Gaertneriomyces sp. JEL0708]